MQLYAMGIYKSPRCSLGVQKVMIFLFFVIWWVIIFEFFGLEKKKRQQLSLLTTLTKLWTQNKPTSGRNFLIFNYRNGRTNIFPVRCVSVTKLLNTYLDPKNAHYSLARHPNQHLGEYHFMAPSTIKTHPNKNLSQQKLRYLYVLGWEKKWI